MPTEAGVPRIDAHHHLWDLAVRDQPWTAELPVLRRTFTVGELLPQLDAYGIDGTVLVQTVTLPGETPELLALAAAYPRIFGVVGWVDLTAPGVGDRTAGLRSLPGGERLVGIRHQVQAEPDPRWLLRDDVLAGLAEVARAGLAYDLVVTHDQLPAAVEVAGRVPELRFVLDHAGKPPIAAGGLDPWREHLTALAAHPNVACKLSGLATEAGPEWTVADLAPYADHVLEAFGADRVMAGSDWPVCLLRGSYGEIERAHRELVASLTAAESAQVMGGTAARWYRLEWAR
ncbi:MAG: amidohydrolase family protein [Micromonosporaceae bacterium]